VLGEQFYLDAVGNAFSDVDTVVIEGLDETVQPSVAEKE
jgi:hypothetical protein